MTVEADSCLRGVGNVCSGLIGDALLKHGGLRHVRYAYGIENYVSLPHFEVMTQLTRAHREGCCCILEELLPWEALSECHTVSNRIRHNPAPQIWSSIRKLLVSQCTCRCAPRL